MIRCGIYTNKNSLVSTEKQRLACQDFAVKADFKVLEKRYDDFCEESIPALIRPAMKELFADVEACEVDFVLFYAPDCVTKSESELSEIQQLFEERNVRCEGIKPVMGKLNLQEFRSSLLSIWGVEKQDKYGNTVLHKAVGCFDYEVIKLLIEKGADVNVKNKEQRTPLHDAALAGNAEAIQALLEEGADVNATDCYEHTPLHWASMMSCEDAVIKLIEGGANINAKDDTGRTPLHEAVFMRELENIRAILEAGGDPDARDHKGLTPMDLAYEDGVLEELTAYKERKQMNGYEDSVDSIIKNSIRAS